VVILAQFQPGDAGAQYVWGGLAFNKCPPNSSPISNEADCKAAAASVNANFQKSIDEHQSLRGCLMTDSGSHVYFNSNGGSECDNSGKQQTICKPDAVTSSYMFGGRNRNNCAQGASYIADWVQCKKAASSLGLSFQRQIDEGSSLHGCLMTSYQGHVYFNRLQGSTEQNSQQTICLTGCKSVKVTGRWAYQYMITGKITETWDEGTTQSFTNSQTSSWSSSITSQVSAGLTFEGIGGSSSRISSTISQAASIHWKTIIEHSVSHSWPIQWSDEDKNKAAWKFILDDHDSCGHLENTFIMERAVTKDRATFPCCFPGYTDDGYKSCTSSESIIPGGEKQGCKVKAAVGRNGTASMVKKSTDVSAPAITHYEDPKDGVVV
jgi:hypothetical protein